jgi:HlyD family secretion protein
VAAIEPSGQTASNVVTYNVLCNVEPVPTDVQLLPSMTATVTIILEHEDNAVLVPNSAIAYAESQIVAGRVNRPAGGAGATGTPQARGQGQGQGFARGQGQGGQGRQAQQDGQAEAGQTQGTPGAVFVMQNGTPTLVRVQLGSSDGDNTRVLSGLEPGDEVVTGASGGSQGQRAASSNQQGQRPGLPAGGGAVFVGGPGGGGARAPGR